MASLGVFHGMLKPILFMPSFVTCSLSMAAAPELTRRQTDGRPLCALSSGMLRAALGVGAAAAVGVWLTALLIANVFFRQTALLPLLRGSCCLIPVIAAAHVCGGMMNALGLQGRVAENLAGRKPARRTGRAAARARRRSGGAVASLGAVQGLTLLLSLRTLRRSGCIARSR